MCVHETEIALQIYFEDKNNVFYYDIFAENIYHTNWLWRI